MIFLKLIGVMLILSVGGFCATSAVRYEKKRIRVLDGWIDLIQYIRAKIDCYLMPLGEILSDSATPLSPLCTSDASDTDLAKILHASSAFLDGDSLRLLNGFVGEIGTTYREEQLRRCDYYVSALRAQRERIAAELPTRTRLSVTLSLCIALGTAVLLW